MTSFNHSIIIRVQPTNATGSLVKVERDYSNDENHYYIGNWKIGIHKIFLNHEIM